MVELLIIRQQDGQGEILKMKTDDGKIVFEHHLGKEDELKWLFSMPLNLLLLIHVIVYLFMLFNNPYKIPIVS